MSFYSKLELFLWLDFYCKIGIFRSIQHMKRNFLFLFHLYKFLLSLSKLFHLQSDRNIRVYCVYYANDRVSAYLGQTQIINYNHGVSSIAFPIYCIVIFVDRKMKLLCYWVNLSYDVEYTAIVIQIFYSQARIVWVIENKWCTTVYLFWARLGITIYAPSRVVTINLFIVHLAGSQALCGNVCI